MSPGDERFRFQDPAAEQALRTLAVLIDEHVPAGMGFGVLLFHYGPGGGMFWISNSHREDMKRSMVEWLEKEGGHDQTLIRHIAQAARGKAKRIRENDRGSKAAFGRKGAQALEAFASDLTAGVWRDFSDSSQEET